MCDKTCKCCSGIKNVDCFSKNNRYKDRLEPICKDCVNTRRQLYVSKNPQFNKNRAKRAQDFATTINGKYTTLIKDLKKAGINSFFTFEDFYALKDFVCDYCKKGRDKFSVCPRNLSLGYVSNNLQPICTSCKKAKMRAESEESFQKLMIRRYGITPEKQEYLNSLIGQTFNYLTVISIGDKVRSHYYLNCKCICGKNKIIRESDLIKSNIKSCGCMKKNNNYNGLLTARKKLTLKSNDKQYSLLKSRARHRNLSFTITQEDYTTNYYNKQCNYCGTENCTGLDRIDSSVGYEPTNVVPCCQICNSMKNTLGVEEFLNHIEKIQSFVKKSPQKV